MAGQADEVNDAFHQFVLDAVYDKESAHRGEAAYKAAGRGYAPFQPDVLVPLRGGAGRAGGRGGGVFGHHRAGPRQPPAQGGLHGLCRADDLRMRLPVPLEPAALSEHRAARLGDEPA